jgi:hypothetical protein
MPQLTSPRLPGVPLLQAQSTSPEYSRWRRNIKFALQGKGTWKYCNGKCPMPMPEAGATSPTSSTTNLQPSLLEERRSWVRHDREVKLDIFLSLAEEVMQDVFDVGPPLPPSSLNAQEMMDALDERFAVFKFEAYHHAFCHFLNLHIDQYPSIEDFNQEFLITLEDLLDHGHPLSNVQACSAYFSKLRCTQNPWVAKKLKEWDTQTGEISCIELLKESPPWSIIRPLVTKSSQNFQVDSIPEEYLEDSSASDSDVLSEKSIASTGSSVSLHSRHSSESTVHTVQSQESRPQRQDSVTTRHSQEITVHAASEDIAESKPEAFRKEIRVLPAFAIPERGSSKNQVPGTSLCDDPKAPLPEWFVSKKSVARRPLPPPHDRPLPPLPPQVQQAKELESNSKSVSSIALAIVSKKSSQISLTAPSTSCPQLPPLKLETTHPTLRPQTPPAPQEIHPALRIAPSASSSSLNEVPNYFNLEPPTEHKRPSTSSPNLAIPWPSTPDIQPRPHSSRAILPSSQAPNPMPSQAQAQPATPPRSFPELHEPHLRRTLSSASEISLPLQGTRDSAWDYLYESKGGYLVTRDHSVSPISRREPTYEDSVVVTTSSPKLGLVARLSGDGLLGEEKETRQKKKKSWNVGVNLNLNMARFSAGRGVKEII